MIINPVFTTLLWILKNQFNKQNYNQITGCITNKSQADHKLLTGTILYYYNIYNWFLKERKKGRSRKKKE